MIVKSFNRPTPNNLVYKHSKWYYPEYIVATAATMLTNDSYFIGNLYHLIIYSSKCAYNYEIGVLCEFCKAKQVTATF